MGYMGATERLGAGEVQYADGCVFNKMDNHTGLYKNRPNGRGYFYCPICPLQYDGRFNKGRPAGYGVMKGSDASTFWGHFNDGLRHGSGVLNAHGATIDGHWHNDQLGGGYVQILLDGDLVKQFGFKRYIGSMQDGLPHGDGELTWPDGASYRGTFRTGLRHGKGAMKDEQGRLVLDGVWADDTPTGRVTTYCLRNKKRPQDTRVYSGSLEKGERKGYGELYQSMAGGLIYEGLWHNNMPHGRGVMHTKGGTYEGEFVQGQRHGKGRFTWNEKPAATGPKRYYEGDWVNDKPEGRGVYLAQDGVSYTFEFEKGKPTEKSRKSYRQGPCGSAPPIGEAGDFAMEDTPVHSIHPEYWGKDKGIKLDSIKALSRLGEGLWPKHEAHAFEYRKSEGTSAPAPPQKEMLRRPSSLKAHKSPEDSSNLMYIITVKRAEGLPEDAQVTTKQGPYVKVLLHSHQKKTKAHLKGGSNPEWNASLELPYSVERNIFFEVYNQGSLFQDEFVGAGHWELGQWLKTGGTAEHNVRIELFRENKKSRETVSAGHLDFGIEIVPRPENRRISEDTETERGIENLPPHLRDKYLEPPVSGDRSFS
eukprot:Protomagalhaensia_sp_Gyna_25__3024@NODE_278_length_4066_cov_46_669729_g213_i0_p1_GENE_NODE_278_length_4066_cov_46_669729_g213_i0NODE_278_length_4066_cov_46_669729_g213_i0_p1_ORF_typecomplete_len590_score135_07MORN/PF02493_20/2_6e03MORN/PF02493_20/6_1e02MORN/PF02493_20/2_6MORN/PF02493_20/0_17MORN/PF02493_20/5_4e02MORN/PF02493_20/0_0001MORN/PF02493_20/0_47MORN/PF02493_20/8_7e03MORN/PF02493_20/1_5e02MORN/PF02493_20/0_0012MORN/PF02493_20/1_4e06MORN/PF02493_20/2_9e05C2/PF00168_30/1_9e11_NODE_278_leng